MFSQRCIVALVGCLALVALVCSAQDYDDEGFNNNNQNNNQGDNDGYGSSGYGNDDSYSGNPSGNNPNYQQNNVDSEGSHNQPTNYAPQAGNDNDGDYEGDDGAAASAPAPVVSRIKRNAIDEQQVAAASQPKLRVKRHGKSYIGPVYTYVKTDKHANFKWGVKHKVGKKHHG